MRTARQPRPAHDDRTFREKLANFIPSLRAFACTLCGDRDEADDLAQETLVRAWQSREWFEAGTNLKAWLFMILRNHFYSTRRRAWRQRPWDESVATAALAMDGAQTATLALQDVARAMRRLPKRQRDALLLVGVGGLSCDEAACICHCPVGTIKSRVARARKALLTMEQNRRAYSPRCKHDRLAMHDILVQSEVVAQPITAASQVRRV